MYYTELARAILQILASAFPRRLHLHELQAELPHYQVVAHGDWLLAVQALRLDGLINGVFLDEDSSIADAAAMYITAMGKSELRKDESGDPVRPNVGAEKLKVFLCHSSGDKKAIRGLYGRLQTEGFQPWLDEEDIVPGQEWDSEIRRAVRSSHVVLVCLSPSSITKEGYVQKEIRFALDIADEKPPGTIFVIPVCLEPCELPDRLSKWHRVDLYSPKGYDRLVSALRSRDQQRSKPDSAAGKQEQQGGAAHQNKPAPPLSLTEKLRRSLSEQARADEEIRSKQQMQAEHRETARKLGPEKFESLAVQLREKGELLNAEKLAGFPPFVYVPVNHRLDAGKYAIELSPYAALDSYSVRVLVGLHPNAAQFLPEIPNIRTRELRLFAAMDEDEFCWVDQKGKKHESDQVIEEAVEVLCELILDDARQLFARLPAMAEPKVPVLDFADFKQVGFGRGESSELDPPCGFTIVIRNKEQRYETRAENLKCVLSMKSLDGKELRVDNAPWFKNESTRTFGHFYSSTAAIGMLEEAGVVCVIKRESRFFAARYSSDIAPAEGQPLAYGDWAIELRIEGENIRKLIKGKLSLLPNGTATFVPST